MSYRTEFLQECLIIDTETTNKDARAAELIEIGFSVLMDDGKWKGEGILYRPDEPIDPEASAVNNITDEMVADSHSFREGVTAYNALLESLGLEVIRVAHNSVYDQTVLNRYGVAEATRPWLCTFKMAKKLYADDPTVTLKNLPYLRYRFKLIMPDGLDPHRAAGDAVLTGMLLEHMVIELETRGILNENEPYYAQVMDWYETPMVIELMPFGKHKGKSLEAVPMSYWKWAINNVDALNEDNEHYDADLANSVAAVIDAKIS